MANRPKDEHYDKTLFQSRRKILTTTNLYTRLHERIKTTLEETKEPIVLLDAGCGEGTHLQQILNITEQKIALALGIDLAKDGIVEAAKQYNEPLFLVSDLANPPLIDESCHIILNILSPANYHEFKRLLTPKKGILIKVIPRMHYLIELRDALLHGQKQKNDHNEQAKALFQQNFTLIDQQTLYEVRRVDPEDLKHLLK